MVAEEIDFLREIEGSPAEETARLIYADWLEERGDPRAEYLRLECELHQLAVGSPRFRELTTELRDLRDGFDPHWLVAVGRTRVGNCASFSLECPNKWEWLVATEEPLVRFCDHCRKHVHYCSSLSEAQRLAWEGKCVAIDSAMTDANLQTRDGIGVSQAFVMLEHVTMGEISFDDDLPSRRRTLEDVTGTPPPPEPSWWQRLLPWSNR
jgi:uncharacterized protein (TIGR02996 family)